MIGVPSKLTVIHKDAALTRVSPTLDLKYEGNTTLRKWNCYVAQAELLKMQKSGQFPDELVGIKV